MKIPTIDATNSMAQLSASVKLIARIWLAEPDQLLLDTLSIDAVRDGYEGLGGVVPVEASPNTIDQLACDYCRLLIGPRDHLPPVQSIWQQHQFQGEAAASTRAYFELIPGYEPPAPIADHLANQLDYVAELLASDLDRELVNDMIRAFGRKHLVWCDPLLQRVAAKAETDFYRGLPRVTSLLIKEILSRC